MWSICLRSKYRCSARHHMSSPITCSNSSSFFTQRMNLLGVYVEHLPTFQDSLLAFADAHRCAAATWTPPVVHFETSLVEALQLFDTIKPCECR
jgi:hypothetical protein